jgi:ADP-heptose:LPS heptosyltransferase
MEYRRADYTEIWISRPVVPLISFADRVLPLSATGIDLVGVGDLGIPAKLESTLRAFDSIVSWYGAAREEFRDAIQALGVPCTFLRALPPENYAGHATRFFCEQVGAPDALPRLRVEPVRPSPRIVIHPFSGSARKNWPLEEYRELAEQFDEGVSWIAGPEEQLCDAVRFDDLGALAQWLSGARLYIGNDSGITHLAAALGVPTLALFGPTDPQKWAPRGENVCVLRHQPLAELEVETVLESANRLLGLG